jgi:hypothetical protein
MIDRALLEKFLGMLGSAFDGERANAAGMILKMAQSQRITIVELCMGKGEPNGNATPDYWRKQYNMTRQKADRLELEVATLKKQLEQHQKTSNKFDFNGKSQQRASGQKYSAAELHELALDMHEQQSPRLSDWERNFLKNMEGWGDSFLLSDKQLYTIQKIYAKVSAAY